MRNIFLYNLNQINDNSLSLLGHQRSSSTKYRLIYIKVRFLLEYLEVKFEDKKYMSREEWAADKEQFLKTNALANIPYLKDGDKVIFES